MISHMTTIEGVQVSAVVFMFTVLRMLAILPTKQNWGRSLKALPRRDNKIHYIITRKN